MALTSQQQMEEDMKLFPAVACAGCSGADRNSQLSRRGLQ